MARRDRKKIFRKNIIFEEKYKLPKLTLIFKKNNLNFVKNESFCNNKKSKDELSKML